MKTEIDEFFNDEKPEIISQLDKDIEEFLSIETE